VWIYINIYSSIIGVYHYYYEFKLCYHDLERNEFPHSFSRCFGRKSLQTNQTSQRTYLPITTTRQDKDGTSWVSDKYINTTRCLYFNFFSSIHPSIHSTLADANHILHFHIKFVQESLFLFCFLSVCACGLMSSWLRLLLFPMMMKNLVLVVHHHYYYSFY